jgi:hypothetical protein
MKTKFNVKHDENTLKLLQAIHEMTDGIGNEEHDRAGEEFDTDPATATGDAEQRMVEKYGHIGPGGYAIAKAIGIDGEALVRMAAERASISMDQLIEQALAQAEAKGEDHGVAERGAIDKQFLVTYLDGFFAGAAWAKDVSHD